MFGYIIIEQNGDGTGTSKCKLTQSIQQYNKILPGEASVAQMKLRINVAYSM